MALFSEQDFYDFASIPEIGSIDNLTVSIDTLSNPAFERFEDNQVKWLEDEMSSSDAIFKVVVGHHAILSNSEAHGDQPPLKTRNESKTSIKDIVERYGDVWFNGMASWRCAI